MDNQAPESEQRKSFRCRVVGHRQDAKLKSGRRCFPVLLYDESSGGYSVISPEKLDVKQGEQFQLETSTGTFAVRVAHAFQMQLGGGTMPAETVYRIGLERIGEIEDDAPTGTRRSVLRPGGGGGGSLLNPNIAAVVVLGVVLLVVTLGIYLSMTKASTLVENEGGQLALNTGSVGNCGQVLHEVCQRLSLTKLQQEQLQEIAVQTVDALESISDLWKDDPPELQQQKMQQVLQAANHEVIRILDERQRQRWTTIVK